MMNPSYLDIFDVKVKYWQQPRGKGTTIYYKRRVPKDLLEHYANQKAITQSTHKSNIKDAISELFRINKSVEVEWKYIREKRNRGESPINVVADARSLLLDCGINHQEEGDEQSALIFSDYLDAKLPYEAQQQLFELSFSDADEYQDIRRSILEKYLAPHELVAIDINKNEYVLYLSDYVQPYAELKGFKESSKQFKDATRAVKQFIDKKGDRPPHQYSRQEINDFINFRLYSASTGTVERNFNVLNAMINKVNREYEIEKSHKFAKPNIPNKGEDKKDRKDFSVKELEVLRAKLEGSSNTIDCLIKIMMDTGMRVSEVVGLASKDIKLDCETPYIELHKNPFRRLKTKNSERLIPLVGLALEAVKLLNLGDSWAFERYLSDDRESFKSTSASNAANNRIRKVLGVKKDCPTSHSFRHTMQTRLRNVMCPEDIREEVLGWRASISERYGSPTDIGIKSDYMLKTLD